MTKKQINAAKKATEAKLRELIAHDASTHEVTVGWWSDAAPLRISEISVNRLDRRGGSSWTRCDTSDLHLRAETYALAYAFTNGKIEESDEFSGETSQLERAVRDNDDDAAYLQNLSWRLSLYACTRPGDTKDMATAQAAIARVIKRAEKAKEKK